MFLKELWLHGGSRYVAWIDALIILLSLDRGGLCTLRFNVHLQSYMWFVLISPHHWRLLNDLDLQLLFPSHYFPHSRVYIRCFNGMRWTEHPGISFWRVSFIGQCPNALLVASSNTWNKSTFRLAALAEGRNSRLGNGMKIQVGKCTRESSSIKTYGYLRPRVEIPLSEPPCKEPFVYMSSPASTLHHDMSVMMNTYVRLQSLIPKAVIWCVREQRRY